MTADESGKPLSRITWTGLIRNGLDYLVSKGYVDKSNRRTKRAYEALENPEVDGLLDAANIVSSQMKQHSQFPTWLESVFSSLSQETRHPDLLDMLKALQERGATLLTTNYNNVLQKYCGLHVLVDRIRTMFQGFSVETLMESSIYMGAIMTHMRSSWTR